MERKEANSRTRTFKNRRRYCILGQVVGGASCSHPDCTCRDSMDVDGNYTGRHNVSDRPGNIPEADQNSDELPEGAFTVSIRIGDTEYQGEVRPVIDPELVPKYTITYS